MADRNLNTYYRGGRFSTREGMILEIPPSGFEWGTSIPSTIDPFTEDNSTQQFPLGTRLIYGDRWFRYALNGGVALIAGSVVGARAVEANHDELAVPTAAAAAKTLSVTLGATAVTINEYRDGILYINEETGEGYGHLIASHPAADSSAACVFTLVDPLNVAFGASTEVSLVHSPWAEIITTAVTTRVGQVVGVAQCPITAAQYGWVQTHGPCPVLGIGTLVIGNDAVVPTGTSGGAAGPRTTALAVKEGVIGRVMRVGVTTDHSLIFLTIE